MQNDQGNIVGAPFNCQSSKVFVLTQNKQHQKESSTMYLGERAMSKAQSFISQPSIISGIYMYRWTDMAQGLFCFFLIVELADGLSNITSLWKRLNFLHLEGKAKQKKLSGGIYKLLQAKNLMYRVKLHDKFQHYIVEK